jgi:hypothetical protein
MRGHAFHSIIRERATSEWAGSSGFDSEKHLDVVFCAEGEQLWFRNTSMRNHVATLLKQRSDQVCWRAKMPTPNSLRYKARRYASSARNHRGLGTS